MLGLIVEGHGEVNAAPVLIRRVLSEVRQRDCPPFMVHRVPKSRLLKAGELERALETLSRQVGAQNPILVLMDADEECPMDLAAGLNARCRDSHPHLRVSVVIANREYEAWFLAAAMSLAGRSGLPVVLNPPEYPEAILGAKEWISERMEPGRTYSETRHQAAFSAAIVLEQARACRSFRKFEKEVLNLLAQP